MTTTINFTGLQFQIRDARQRADRAQEAATRALKKLDEALDRIEQLEAKRGPGRPRKDEAA